jgi:hypothetical protein
MAISAATVLRAYDFQRLRSHTHTISAVEYDVMTCKVDCEYITTAYAVANDATFAPATMIQNALRDGRTATILDACVVAPGRYYLAATPTTIVPVSAGPNTSVTTGTVTHPLTAEDLTTEMTDTTALNTATFVDPITFQVTFHVPTVA